MKKVRKNRFRLGRLHGKLQAAKGKSEADIQRKVFLTQNLQLWRTQKDCPKIRIFGYEIPLYAGCSRGECIDLIGYDKDHALYLIELKKGKSQEKISDVVEQVKRYEEKLKKILPYIRKEFKDSFFLPIKFSGKIKKLLLAPEEYYDNKELLRTDVEYCYFRDRKIHDRKPGDIIHIHLIKK